MQVLTALGAVSLASAAGCALQQHLGWANSSLSLLLTACAIFAFSVQSSPSPCLYATFLLMGFLQGFSLGPQLGLAFEVDSSVLLVATLAATAVFVSLTLVVVLAKRHPYIFACCFLTVAILGASAFFVTLVMIARLAKRYPRLFMASGLVDVGMFARSILLVLPLFDIVSEKIFLCARLSAAVMILWGYILFDVQMIMEKSHAGDSDDSKGDTEPRGDDGDEDLKSEIALFIERTCTFFIRFMEKKECRGEDYSQKQSSHRASSKQINF